MPTSAEPATGEGVHTHMTSAIQLLHSIDWLSFMLLRPSQFEYFGDQLSCSIALLSQEGGVHIDELCGLFLTA